MRRNKIDRLSARGKDAKIMQMAEANNPNLLVDPNSERLRRKIINIYSQHPSEDEKLIVEDCRHELVKDEDPAGIELRRDLRASLKDLESVDTLRVITEAARAELKLLPPDFLEQTLIGYEALIKNLPAGHGKGHVLRDVIYLVGMLRDPKLEREKIDEVELLVGIMAGMYHDIGNSIVGRYEDPYKMAGHAEIGAVLFAKVAKGTPETGRLIPENLTKLIQYAIAAHTNYPPTREVTLPDGTKGIPGSYADETDGELRRSVWLTRQSDRRDTANVAQLIRDMIVRTAPIQDFHPETQEYIERLSPEEHFSLVFGFAPENINQSLISNVSGYSKNVFKDNAYTSHDSDYFTHSLMEPGVGDVILLLSVIAPEKRDEVLDDISQNDPEAAARLRNEPTHYAESIHHVATREISPEDISQAVEQYKQICRAVEPASDLEETLHKFETHFFEQLTTEDQEKWARAILFINEVLLTRWRGRLIQNAYGDLHLGSKITSQDPVVRQQFDEIGEHLQAIAQQFVGVMGSGGESV